METKHPLCAVKDCPNPGQPQICLADGKYHHHGCIHYGTEYPYNTFEYREGGWYWMCDEHYAQLKANREAYKDPLKQSMQYHGGHSYRIK